MLLLLRRSKLAELHLLHLLGGKLLLLLLLLLLLIRDEPLREALHPHRLLLRLKLRELLLRRRHRHLLRHLRRLLVTDGVLQIVLDDRVGFPSGDLRKVRPARFGAHERVELGSALSRATGLTSFSCSAASLPWRFSSRSLGKLSIRIFVWSRMAGLVVGTGVDVCRGGLLGDRPMFVCGEPTIAGLGGECPATLGC